MNTIKQIIRELHVFLLLWSTQACSQLGSSMTSFALIIWSLQQSESAMVSAMLSICSYTPYVLFGLFAGSLCDRWDKKKTILICDSLAAASTVVIAALLWQGKLEIWHLYILNAVNGLMNTLQQPSSEVVITLLTPKKHYARAGALRMLSNSLNTLLVPILATSVYMLFGCNHHPIFTAVLHTACNFYPAPAMTICSRREKQTHSAGVKAGCWLRTHRGVLDLVLSSCYNLIASYDAALPYMLLMREGGGEGGVGLVNTCIGFANLSGSLLLLLRPTKDHRVRLIHRALLISMGTESFFLAFGRESVIWCLGAILGWLFIPAMNTNMDVLLREHIPLTMQGRVYAARNSLQFFTIPVGYFLGGALIDYILEPFMAGQAEASLLVSILGSGKGSGAALLFLILGLAGIAVCLLFRRDKNIWSLEEHK
ncbi:MAG: MFS transporter [Clostridium sp.]